MFKSILFLCVLLPAFSFCAAQDGWELKSNKDNIKCYSKPIPNSKINAVRLETVFTATLSQFVAVLLDVESFDKWIYKSMSTRLLKRVSPSEMFYYSEVDFPWPTANRDYVSQMKISQDPASKVVYINAKNVPGWVPVKSGIVRIEQSVGEWTVTPIANNQIKIEYILKVNPGGELPGWLINSFSLGGPVETFKNLREWIKKPTYVSAHLPFIID
jgi:hypothetical protein